jgi:predicted nucleic acid-binding protein
MGESVVASVRECLLSAEGSRLTWAGKPTPFASRQVAAIAATNAFVLVTFNGDDYSALRDLLVEDWRTR